MLGIPVVGGYLIAAALVIGLGVGGYTGWHERSLRADAAALKTEQVALDHYQAQTIVLNTVSQNLETKIEDVRLVTLTINRQVDQIVRDPLYSRACLDDDGLRAANAAIAGPSPDPGKSDGRLSVTIGPGGRDGGVGSPQAGGNQ